MKEKIFKGLTLFITVTFILEMLPLQVLADDIVDEADDLKNIYNNNVCAWGVSPEGRTTADNLFTQEVYFPINKFWQISGRKNTAENSFSDKNLSTKEKYNGKTETFVVITQKKDGNYIGKKWVIQHPIIYYNARMESIDAITSEFTSRVSGPEIVTKTVGKLGWCVSQKYFPYCPSCWSEYRCTGSTGSGELPADVIIQNYLSKDESLKETEKNRLSPIFKIQYYFTPTDTSIVDKIQLTTGPQTISNINDINQVVKDYTWIIQGSDEQCSYHVGPVCTEHRKTAWALMKGVYLTASGSVFDARFWNRETKDSLIWGNWIGFLVGWALNIIIPGSGTLIWAITIGDMVATAGFFINFPAVDVSSTFTKEGIEITPCSLIIPAFQSQPINAEITCNSFIPPKGNEAIKNSLQIIPDAGKSGLVTGYNLYRNENLIHTEINFATSTAQTSINYTDTDSALQGHTTYTYRIEPLVLEESGNSASCDIETKIQPNCYFNAFPTTVFEFTNTTLSWGCSNYNYVDICNLFGGNLNLQGLSPQGGSQQTLVNEETTYCLTCYNNSYPSGSLPQCVKIKTASGIIHE